MSASILPNPSLERVQIQRLSGIVFALSSLAAMPGFFGSLYLLVIVASELSPTTRTFNARSWLTFGPFMVAMILGWWLYRTYWRELQGVNRFGKLSWLVSALLNAGLALYPITTLYRVDEPFLADVVWYGFLLLYCLTMTVLSVWVWIFQLRK